MGTIAALVFTVLVSAYGGWYVRGEFQPRIAKTPLHLPCGHPARDAWIQQTITDCPPSLRSDFRVHNGELHIEQHDL